MVNHHSAESVKRETFTVMEAGRILGVGRTVAYRAARCGEIPTVRVGGRLLVPRVRLERFLAGEDK